MAYGKTSAVEYYYRKKAHLVLSGKKGYLEQMPELSEIRQSVIVFDDISWVTDQESREYVIRTIKTRKEFGKQIVVIGRSRMPGWLRVTAVDEEMVTAGEYDLMFSEEETKKMLSDADITALEEEVKQITQDLEGNALALKYAVFHLKALDDKKPGTCGYNNMILQQVRLDLYHYYDYAFYDCWDVEMREMLMAMCQYATFTIQMTEMITGNSRVPVLLEKALSIGTFLTKLDEHTYSYRKPLQLYLQWKQELVYTKEQIVENYESAAKYFELVDQVEDALRCWKRAGNDRHIAELLEKNAMSHPGTAHFFETREYYLSLPDETIQRSPVLMSGLSMLHAIMFQAEQSEYWYGQLQKYEETAEWGSAGKKEAMTRIAYLNISLPQRGIHGIIQILKNTAVLCMNRQMKLPEFSVTSNLPSIMNGGLDFCEWSRNDRELGIFMKKPVEIVLGKYGVGLVNIALAESGMENGTMDSYEIQTRLNNGYMMSDSRGKIEMCFAAVGLLIREHLSKGQPEIAENLYQSFLRKVQNEKAEQLMPNLETFHMWMQLILGKSSAAKEWLESAPDDMVAFCILDRYHYINKIRVYMVQNRLAEARALIERMNLYFTDYERHYLWMENQILKAVVQYRKGEDEWRETLKTVLKKTERYHFIRIVAREGAAIKPLLEQIGDTECSETYMTEIRGETDRIALYYPDYLKEERALKVPLTEAEGKILKLLCRGTSNEDICQVCSISYSGLKFHTHNIYKKLGVGKRADAEREAVRLGLDQ